jgi:hypothetical protein
MRKTVPPEGRVCWAEGYLFVRAITHGSGGSGKFASRGGKQGPDEPRPGQQVASGRGDNSAAKPARQKTSPLDESRS